MLVLVRKKLNRDEHYLQLIGEADEKQVILEKSAGWKQQTKKKKL